MQSVKQVLYAPTAKAGMITATRGRRSSLQFRRAGCSGLRRPGAGRRTSIPSPRCTAGRRATSTINGWSGTPMSPEKAMRWGCARPGRKSESHSPLPACARRARSPSGRDLPGAFAKSGFALRCRPGRHPPACNRLEERLRSVPSSGLGAPLRSPDVRRVGQHDVQEVFRRACGVDGSRKAVAHQLGQ